MAIIGSVGFADHIDVNTKILTVGYSVDTIIDVLQDPDNNLIDLFYATYSGSINWNNGEYIARDGADGVPVDSPFYIGNVGFFIPVSGDGSYGLITDGGNFQVEIAAFAASGQSVFGLNSLVPDVAYGSAFGDVISVYGGDDTVYAGDGNDTVLAGAGADFVYGQAGADKLVGGAGDDKLDGGDGNDTIFAGSGNDTVYGGAGTDILDLNYAAGPTVTTFTSAVDGVSAGSGIDSETFFRVERIYGSNFVDLINGGSGDDYFAGRAGADFLSGGGGNDTLLGQDGADTLAGGNGNDFMSGGAGSDVFRFDTPLDAISNVDKISDFSNFSDQIQLDGAIFAALGGPGPLAQNSFYQVGIGTFDSQDRIIYNAANGLLYYDADGAGGAAAIRFAQLTNMPATLNAGDFQVV